MCYLQICCGKYQELCSYRRRAQIIPVPEFSRFTMQTLLPGSLIHFQYSSDHSGKMKYNTSTSRSQLLIKNCVLITNYLISLPSTVLIEEEYSVNNTLHVSPQKDHRFPLHKHTQAKNTLLHIRLQCEISHLRDLFTVVNFI